LGTNIASKYFNKDFYNDWKFGAEQPSFRPDDALRPTGEIIEG